MTAVLVPGLALGGVLAVAAAWSSLARPGPLPHLGVGALAGVAVTLGARLDAAPAAVAFVLVAAVGGGLAWLAHALDHRLRVGVAAPVALTDVAVLAGAVALVGVLAPLNVGPSASGVSGPLGGVPGTVGGLAAFAIGGGAAVVLVSPAMAARVGGAGRSAQRWGAAGAALAASAVLAGGALTAPDVGGEVAVLVAADPVGLALRTVAAALAGRGQPAEAAVAGLGLGFGEVLLRVVDPTGATAVLPAVSVAVLAIAGARPPGDEQAAAGWA